MLPNIKDCEFLNGGGKNSALMIRRSATEIDVLDSEQFDLAFNIKADQPKCI
jgi:hypothetical protein